MRLGDVKGDVVWSALEAELLRCAPLGKMAALPDKGDCPEDTTDPVRRVRAGLIRWLLLGGSSADKKRTHPKGVMLRGAWVDGVLDFEGCKTRLDCKLVSCLFPDRPSFRDAELRGLYLTGAQCRQGLDLHRLKTETDVHFHNGFRAIGLVDLGAAIIGGQINCEGAHFQNHGKTALKCDAAKVGRGILLRKGFKVEGDLDFNRVCVGNNLVITDATLDGKFIGPSIEVKAGFFFQRVGGARPHINLRDARVGVLHDDKASWELVGKLFLNGLTYEHINGMMTVDHRIEWLTRKYNGEKGLGNAFLPQPWTQLAKVLTASGDRRAASRVREAREVRMAWAEFAKGRADARKRWRLFPLVLARAGWSALFRAMFGYGHAPARVFWWIGGLVALTALLFGIIYDMGQMAPNSAVVLTSADWLEAVHWADRMHTYPMHIWVGTGAFAGMPSAIDYETFSSLLYAFDQFIPLDAIGQQAAWAPSHDRGVWGAVGYWARFPIQVAGWVIAAVGAAVVTGLLGKKDEG